MSQRDLETAIAAATGESVSTIRSLGFSIADSLEVYYDPEPLRPQVLARIRSGR